MTKTAAVNSLEPGTVYPTVDDAMRAAMCLCGLHKDGATIYGTTDPAHVNPDTEEAYMVAVACPPAKGKQTWPKPSALYAPVYTITRREGMA